MPSAIVETSMPPQHVSQWGRVARICRWTLIALWSVLAVVAVLAGERQSTLSALDEAVRSGAVQHVQVTPGLEGGRGYTSVQVTWRPGSITYTTEVTEARPLGEAPPRDQRGDSTGVVGDLETHLLALQPGLDISRDDRVTFAGPALGWILPEWSGWLLLLTYLATLLSLTSSPPPWRATRWAWFWLLVLIPPLGVPAYLLLAGPTPLVPAPRASATRLGGGWAFLLTFIAGIPIVLVTRLLG